MKDFLFAFVAPFNPALSKNRKLKRGRGARMYIDPAHKQACDEVEVVARKAMVEQLGLGVQKPLKWLYLDIAVHRPSKRVDAHNFIDAIMDCIQRVTGLNDRYMGVKCVPVENKNDPCVNVVVFQTEERVGNDSASVDV